MITLSGKTVLVTGAWRGIGRSSALALPEAGAQVLVHYGRGAKEADSVVAPGVVQTDMSNFTKTDEGRDYGSVFRRSSVSPSPTTSAASSLSWPRTTPAGSLATLSGSTAARSSERRPNRGRRRPQV